MYTTIENAGNNWANRKQIFYNSIGTAAPAEAIQPVRQYFYYLAGNSVSAKYNAP